MYRPVERTVAKNRKMCRQKNALEAIPEAIPGEAIPRVRDNLRMIAERGFHRRQNLDAKLKVALKSTI
jgi:hypothetical protein